MKISLDLRGLPTVAHGCIVDTHFGLHPAEVAKRLCASCAPGAQGACFQPVLQHLKQDLTWNPPHAAPDLLHTLPKVHRQHAPLPFAVVVRDFLGDSAHNMRLNLPRIATQPDVPSSPSLHVLHGFIHFDPTSADRRQFIVDTLSAAAAAPFLSLHAVVFSPPGGVGWKHVQEILPTHITVQEVHFPRSRGHAFPWSALRWMQEVGAGGPWDLVSLWEDDFAVRPHHWAHVQSLLTHPSWPVGWLPGLQQFEEDCTAAGACVRHALNAELSHNEAYYLYHHQGADYAVPSNPHTGGFIVQPAHLRAAGVSGCLARAEPSWSQPLMDAATSAVYQRCGWMKVTPVDRLQDFAVHHVAQNKLVDKAFLLHPDNVLTLPALQGLWRAPRTPQPSTHSNEETAQ